MTERQPGDRAELARRARAERDAAMRDRYRAVGMALDGAGAPAIARAVGRSRRAVQDWAYAYRDGGVDGLTPGRSTGQPTKLARDREAAFAARLEAGPTGTDGGVCTLRGRDVVRILAEEFDADYSMGGAYALLHRLGYSCLTPRPVHEKDDPVAAARFKALAPLL